MDIPPLTKYNPLEPYPNDVIVSARSVFAIKNQLIATDIYPHATYGFCAGKHTRMSKGKFYEGYGGYDIFYQASRWIQSGSVPVNRSYNESVSSDEQESYNEINSIQISNIITGTVFSNESREIRLSVENISATNFTVGGDVNYIHVTLRNNENGDVITPSTSSIDVQYSDLRFFAPMISYTISSTLSGSWSVIINTTNNIPDAGANYVVIKSFKSNIKLNILPDDMPSLPVAGNTVNIKAVLKKNEINLKNASVVANIDYPDGNTETENLYDDGLHDDDLADDGVYGNIIATRQSGIHRAVVIARGIDDGSYFERTGLWTADIGDNLNIYLPFVQRR